MVFHGCSMCGNRFKEDFLANMYVQTKECPIANCGGKINEYDQNTFEISHVLENKGYHLCSIDIPSSFDVLHDIRLRFKDYYSFQSLPDGFKLISYRPKNEIYPIDVVKYLDDSLPRTELYKQIALTCVDLMIWAEKLPG